MRALLVPICLALTIGTAWAADDLGACKARQNDLSNKAAQFEGDAMIKRLIRADLDRANREMVEGDADECNEALDHADSLLAGKF